MLGGLGKGCNGTFTGQCMGIFTMPCLIDLSHCMIVN